MAATQAAASFSEMPRRVMIGNTCTSIPLVTETRRIAPTMISQ